MLAAVVALVQGWQRFLPRSQCLSLYNPAVLQPVFVDTERRFGKHEDTLSTHSYRMPRLKRTVVLTVLVICSSVFLLFQLYYYRTYVNKVGHEEHKQTKPPSHYA